MSRSRRPAALPAACCFLAAVAAAVALALAAALAPAPAAGQDIGGPNAYLDFYRQFEGLAPDPARVATIEAPFAIQRPSFQLILRSGQVGLVELGGEVVGATFSGEGTAIFAPSVQIEQEQLARETGGTRLRIELDGAALLFTDGTLGELEGSLSFGPGSYPGGASRVIRTMVEHFQGEGDETLATGVVSTLLNRLDNDFFHAHLDAASGPDYAYTHDGFAWEEVSLARSRAGRYETLCLLHRDEHYQDGSWLMERADWLMDVEGYRFDISVADNLDMSFDATLALRARRDGPNWVSLSFLPDLQVDSARWASGEAATFHRGDGSDQLWVRLPDGRVGDSHDLRLWYHGEVMQWANSWYGLKTSTGWYPKYGDALPTFDLTFRAPERFPVAGVGEKVLEEREGDRVVTRWVVDEPARHASFNLGPFEVEEHTDPRVPPLTLQIQKEGHAFLISQGVPQMRNPGEKVALDVTNSLAFFQDAYGPLDVPRFQVTEIPYSHGQAFPGMIHLSFGTYLATSSEGHDELFRAHEVAHQWWGLNVGERSYRDAWLEEGLSEFSALWYMQKVRSNPQRYYERLEDLKKPILDLRAEAGPIWLGRRLASAEHPEYYQHVVYGKGAWVFHMLRVLMMELNGQDDAMFAEAIKELFQSYQGQRLSTAELQQHFSAKLGLDLGWFFNQWVYGTAIPTYRFSTRGRETEDGKYQMWGKVIQENVPEGFRNFVPVTFDFGDEGFARIRMEVTGPESIMEFPILPREPDQILFNDLEGILAEVRQEGWRGPDPWAGR